VATPANRLVEVDWPAVRAALDARGHAVLPSLLAAGECASLARLFDDDARFRSTVDMARHRFGEGRYRYFAAPLPPVVAELRTRLYARLAPIANRWNEALGRPARFPRTLPSYQRMCATAGQRRPTPLLLRYETGGWNALHQDLYGELVFPLQVTVMLDRPDVDFTGGDFLLVEQRPRMQSRGHAIALGRGDAVVFPCRTRPAQGARGAYQVGVRHGVSTVLNGRRTTLGIIFHDAR
jgi:uncharacterized protein